MTEDEPDIVITTPQFERGDGREPMDPPEDRGGFEALSNESEASLKADGLRPWDEDHRLWLFPAEWYDHIPDGFPVVTINGRVERFEHGVTDDDRRFGCLPYGIEVGDVE